MNYKKIYSKLDDYSIDNYDDFLSKINSSFRSLTDVSYTIDNNNRPSYTLEELTFNDLHDSFTVRIGYVNFDCLITEVPENANSLFFVFSGSRRPLVDKIPIFKRWSYYKFVNSIVVNIADPMFYEYEELSLGWYYGNKTQSYLQLLALLIKKLQSIFKVNHRNVFFFGSSGGGYVALQLSMYFDNTVHIVINPQINLNKYINRQNFIECTGIDLDAKDPFRRNETLDIVVENINNKNNKFIILQNLTDKHDCEFHLFPLLRQLNVRKAHLGLNVFPHLYVWLYTCIGGHNAQGDQFIFSYILYLAEKIALQGEVSDFDYFLFKNISILWRQREFFMDKVMQYKLSESGESVHKPRL